MTIQDTTNITEEIKVGDRVKVINPVESSKWAFGKILEVVKVEPEIDCYTTEDGQFFWRRELEKCNP